MADLMQRWVSAMRDGRYEAAWAVAEQAMAARDPATRDDPARPYHLRWVWDGRPFDGRDVLVRCYRGLGDTLQFARYLPLLARRAASVTVEAQPRLISLLREMPGIAEVIPFDPARPAPRSECDIEITELAFALRATPAAVPAPYLQVPRAVLPAGTVALCYAAGEWDRERSIPPGLLAPLCRHAPCITLVPEPCELDLLNPQGCPFDIGATAALVAAADLVVTVDTMIAHLSGALGKPTWLLLKAEPDWRWSPRAHTSPWYGSMRLYAQPSPGDWGAVVARVEHDLSMRSPIAARG
jgi:hypothetical protein